MLLNDLKIIAQMFGDIGWDWCQLEPRDDTSLDVGSLWNDVVNAWDSEFDSDTQPVDASIVMLLLHFQYHCLQVQNSQLRSARYHWTWIF